MSVKNEGTQPLCRPEADSSLDGAGWLSHISCPGPLPWAPARFPLMDTSGLLGHKTLQRGHESILILDSRARCT